MRHALFDRRKYAEPDHYACCESWTRSRICRDVGLAAAPDLEIAARAQATGPALLTRDLDFADVRRYPPSLYPGIIVLRLPDGVIAKDIVRVAERFCGTRRSHPIRTQGQLKLTPSKGIGRKKYKKINGRGDRI